MGTDLTALTSCHGSETLAWVSELAAQHGLDCFDDDASELQTFPVSLAQVLVTKGLQNKRERNCAFPLKGLKKTLF